MSKRVLLTLILVSLFSIVSRADWQESGFQYATHAIDVSAQVDEDTTLVVFVADSTYRLYRSMNVDSAWTEMTHYLTYNPSCVLQISGTYKVYIGRYQGVHEDSAGVFRSTNNGDNWDWMSQGTLINREVTCLAYSSYDTSFMFAGCDPYFFPPHYRPVLHWSRNGGYGWVLVPDDIPPIGVSGKTVAFSSPAESSSSAPPNPDAAITP